MPSQHTGDALGRPNDPGTMLIEVAAPDKASWNDLVQGAMPIVDSFQFVR